MAKFYGKIGYAKTEETTAGVWVESITERNYSGDVIKDIRRRQSGENLNDNINITNIISIVADPFAYENVYSIRYAEWMGTKWKVISVEANSPRLNLTLGGLYNEQQAQTT